MISSCKLSTFSWYNLINTILYLYLILLSVDLVDCSSLRWPLPTDQLTSSSNSNNNYQPNGGDERSISSSGLSQSPNYSLESLNKEWLQWRAILNEWERQKQLQQLNLDSIANEKRGLDLGLRRGLSGQRAAKHLVGLANAEFAGGPGKKR